MNAVRATARRRPIAFDLLCPDPGLVQDGTRGQDRGSAASLGDSCRGVEVGPAQEQVLRRLAVRAESRDGSTALHVERMSRYSALLARKLGLGAGECERIRLATQAHDAGKAGLPASILSNPARLTQEEREVAEEHCEIGYRMLAGSGSPLLDVAAQVALTHHERVDGTGYPNGLRGPEIPLVGRIAAIADVFDALTSDRPYRAAWPVLDAVEFMRSERGTHFNLELLDRFLVSLPEILVIKEQYAHPARRDVSAAAVAVAEEARSQDRPVRA